MALDARRRQKKAEKRNAKQKAKRKELARLKQATILVVLEEDGQAVVYAPVGRMQPK
jgi:hypothetical protein